LAVAERDAIEATNSRAALDGLGAVMGTTSDPQELFADETLEQALRQLTLYGRSGLPVLSDDREHLRGWITRGDVLRALARSVEDAGQSTTAGAVAADYGADDPEQAAHRSSAPLAGYEIVHLTITPKSPAVGRRIDGIDWPDGAIVVAVADGGEMVAPNPDKTLRAGERVVVLTPRFGGARHRDAVRVIPDGSPPSVAP
jgi:CIC family chloride channel protein